MVDNKSNMAKSPTPSDKVYDFILEMIVSRQWPSKHKIMTESELCQHLGVSRVAVREAVERLSTLGLLVKRQGAGTFVSEPSVDSRFNAMLPMLMANEHDIRHALEFRRYFEYGNVLLFASQCQPADLAALEDNYARFAEGYTSAPERIGALDNEFHRLIAIGTRNPFVIRVTDILMDIMQSQQTLLNLALITENPIRYHREIIRALQRGDGDVAALLMLKHIDKSLEHYDRSWLAKTRGAGGVPGGKTDRPGPGSDEAKRPETGIEPADLRPRR